MDLNLSQVRKSGILEQFVLGQSTLVEVETINTYLTKYPELRTDIDEIETSLVYYSEAYAALPPEGLISQVKDAISFTKPSGVSSTTKSVNPSTSGTTNRWIAGLLALALAASAYLLNSNSNKQQTIDEQRQLIIDCQEEGKLTSQRMAIIEHINAKGTEAISIEPTPNYPETGIIIYVNAEKKQNILQINSLPQLAANESFQLWSLGSGDPKPMDVFDTLGSKFLSSGFVGESTAYAITIEKKGGSQTPNLEKLIGVFKLS